MDTYDPATVLERLVDTHSIRFVICTLEMMCEMKAEHLETNWQDPASARAWRKLARKLAPAVEATLDL
jgi:hypothetical protein